MSWRCAAELLPFGAGGNDPPESCGAHGDTDRGAERHTKTTGHPTVSGPNAAPDEENR